MINVKEAVAKAVQYVLNIFSCDTISDVRLEEVEFSDNDALWLITVSLVRKPKDTGVVSENLLNMQLPLERIYKILAIDAINGEIKSMKIRQLA
jgi:hypothetical protein